MHAACIALTTAHHAAETALAVANTHDTTEATLVNNGGPTCCHCQWQVPTAPSNNLHISYATHLRAMNMAISSLHLAFKRHAETASLAANGRTDGQDREIAVLRHEAAFLKKQLERVEGELFAEDALVAERAKLEERRKALQAGEAQVFRQHESISEDLTCAAETRKALAARQKQLSTPTLIKVATTLICLLPLRLLPELAEWRAKMACVA
ncbi:hypothetical protein DFH09DRAFT_1373020 [Mycena vulgaris]|nr:hypothetical protein DFH09DRAFT_1373598 [Mycena vulgaris]KAJ6521581.1 hypothetical protein DFH09DRAFT_1373020 [Mycena vulgaris]